MNMISTFAATATAWMGFRDFLRKMLPDAVQAEAALGQNVTGLPQKLQYDVGLVDLCPGRGVVGGAAGRDDSITREMMRRSF